MLSESVYGRTWHTARDAALSPALATTGLAQRPYDLRHAALSLWLNATGAPAEIAARTGNSVRVLHTVYTHRLHGQEDIVSQQIERALRQQNRSPLVTASGSPHRCHAPGLSVICPCMAHIGRPSTSHPAGRPRHARGRELPVYAGQRNKPPARHPASPLSEPA